MHYEAQHLQPPLRARPPVDPLDLDEIEPPATQPEWLSWTAHELLVDAARRWAADLTETERRAPPKAGAAAGPAFELDPFFADLGPDHADEQHLLRRILWQPVLAASVSPRFFRDPLHRRIFEVIRALLKTGKHPVSEWVSRILRYASPFLRAGDHCPAIWERLGDLGWDVPRYIDHLERA